jgi:hypothetical protein
MADTLVTSVLKARVAVELGSMAAINSPLQFGLGDTSQTYRGWLTISGSGGAVTSPTWVLEGSLDWGATWFVVPANTTQPIVVTGTLLTGTTAALFATQYNVSGLAGALFQFGATAGTAWTATSIYALIG